MPAVLAPSNLCVRVRSPEFMVQHHTLTTMLVKVDHVLSIKCFLVFTPAALTGSSEDWRELSNVFNSLVFLADFFRCEYFLVSFLLYHSKLNIFELWIKQDS